MKKHEPVEVELSMWYLLFRLRQVVQWFILPALLCYRCIFETCRIYVVDKQKKERIFVVDIYMVLLRFEDPIASWDSVSHNCTFEES